MIFDGIPVAQCANIFFISFFNQTAKKEKVKWIINNVYLYIISTLFRNEKIYARWNDLTKCFKIFHVFGKWKSTKVFRISFRVTLFILSNIEYMIVPGINWNQMHWHCLINVQDVNASINIFPSPNQVRQKKVWCECTRAALFRNKIFLMFQWNASQFIIYSEYKNP